MEGKIGKNEGKGNLQQQVVLFGVCFYSFYWIFKVGFKAAIRVATISSRFDNQKSKSKELKDDTEETENVESAEEVET